MKVQDLETFVVGNPPPQRGGRYFIFVKLVTDDGVVGYGEVYAAGVGPAAMVALVRDVFERHILGADPHRIETLFRRVYGSGYSHRPDPSLMGAFSGIEIALWDILGKAANKPVHDLLGGRVRERLRAYTYLYPDDGSAQPDEVDGGGVYDNPDRAAERAAAEVAAGFTAVKFDPAGPYTPLDGRQPDLETTERCVAFLARLREAVGGRADLLFGTHGQFTAAGAIRLAQRIAPYDPLWFEEPIPPDDPRAMARVAAATSIPVATGERLTTKWEFARLLEVGGAAILQPNLGRAGGVLEGKKIAALAECFSAQIAPHLYCGPLVAAANIQLAACIPNFLILETIRDFSGFYAELLEVPIPFEDGHVVVPRGPGLGVALNEAVARAHPYEGDRLHLEMQETERVGA